MNRRWWLVALTVLVAARTRADRWELLAVGCQYVAAGQVDLGNIYCLSPPQRSSDGGRTWREIAYPAQGAVMAIAPRDSRVVYLGLRERLWRSTDAGESWSVQSESLPFACADPPTPLSNGDCRVQSLAVDPRDSDIVIAGARSDHSCWLTWCGPLNPGWGMRRSTDGGRGWAGFGPGFPDAFLSWSLEGDALYVYSRSAGSGAMTTDDGGTWHAVNVNQPAIAIDPRDRCHLLGNVPGSPRAAYSRLAWSNDCGTSWTPVGLPFPVAGPFALAQSVESPDRVLASSYGQIFVTDDFGTTWRQVCNPLGWTPWWSPVLVSYRPDTYLSFRWLLAPDVPGDPRVPVTPCRAVTDMPSQPNPRPRVGEPGADWSAAGSSGLPLVVP